MTRHKVWNFALVSLTIVALFGLSVSATMAAPPANDNFSNAAAIDSLPFSDTVNITDATTQSGEPQFCTFSDKTIWYKLTPTTGVELRANTVGSSLFGTNLSVFRDTGSGIFGLSFVGCSAFSGSVVFLAQAGTTYYLQAEAPCCGASGDVRVNVEQRTPPANDNFSNAAAIDLNALPFSDTVNITDATTQSGEPQFCIFSQQTIWYKLTPTTGVWLATNTVGSGLSGTDLSVFRATGSGIFGLSFVGCSIFSGSVTFLAQAGTTYYLQAKAPCCGASGDVRVNVEETAPPLPVASFFFFPGDPSIFDTLQFFDQSFDPGQQGIQSQAWNFGDGATATGCCPTHRYAADGDYTVQLTVTTFDGRTADTSQVASVRTHDVAITRFRVPQSAMAGQTRQITVSIRNGRYPETVRVQLEKSIPGGFGGFQFVGSLEQLVPVRPANRTTDFNFSHTFTSDDACIGKATFRAVATMLSGRDALPADNQAISLPVKVSGCNPTPVDSIAAPVAGGAADVVSGETRATVPAARLALLDVAPNPASAGVDLLVRLSLPVDAVATLQVLDIAGRVVAKHDLGSLGPGIHEARVAWERRPAPGIYWVRLTQGDKSVSTRVGILR